MGRAMACHHPREVFQVEALAFAGRAVFAFAVGAFHGGGDAREFLALLGVGGSGQGQRQLQQFHLAGHILRQLQGIEPRGFLRQIHGQVDEAFIGLGCQGLGVIRNVGGLDPVGAAAIHR